MYSCGFTIKSSLVFSTILYLVFTAEILKYINTMLNTLYNALNTIKYIEHKRCIFNSSNNSKCSFFFSIIF